MIIYRWDYQTPAGTTGTVCASTIAIARDKAWARETGPNNVQGYRPGDISMHRGPAIDLHGVPQTLGMER